MTTVDEILSKYSMTREKATAYIDAIIRMNQTAAAEETDVHRKTIENYKRRFAEMSEEERALLLASLFDERWRELVYPLD